MGRRRRGLRGLHPRRIAPSHEVGRDLGLTHFCGQFTVTLADAAELGEYCIVHRENGRPGLASTFFEYNKQRRSCFAFDGES